MPVRGVYTRIIVDGYDFSGDSNNVEIAAAINQLEVTPFQAVGKEFISEPTESSIMHRGYYNGNGALSMEKAFYDRLATGSAYVSVLLDTNIAACPVYTVPATQNSEFAINSPATGIITMSAKWTAGSGMKHGRRIFGGVVSATGTQAIVDMQAGGTTGGYAFLHLTNYTGSIPTNATVTVQSDTSGGFGAPTTHGTFTMTNYSAAMMTIAGAIGRYVRLNVTSLGGSTNITLTGILAVKGVTM